MPKNTLILILAVSAASAQTPAFCPPPGAKVDPAITVPDDLCTAKPLNSYRLQQQSAPLSFKQKAGYFAQNKIISGSMIFGSAFFGEVAQLQKSPPEWPQGAQGWGERFGTRYAQTLTKNTAEFVFGFMEDPRPSPPPQLYVLQNGTWVRNPRVHSHRHTSFGGRLGGALLHVVWTHYDSGKDNLAYSRIGGAFSSGLVGRLWTPGPENTWGQVGVRMATAFGGYAAGAIFTEFQPDLTKLLAKITGQGKTPKP